MSDVATIRIGQEQVFGEHRFNCDAMPVQITFWITGREQAMNSTDAQKKLLYLVRANVAIDKYQAEQAAVNKAADAYDDEYFQAQMKDDRKLDEAVACAIDRLYPVISEAELTKRAYDRAMKGVGI